MSSNTKGEETVYHTRTGAKYHRERCSYLRSCYSIALKDAVKRYSPCSRCNPPLFSVKSDNSSFDSCQSTLHDSKQTALRNTRISDDSDEKVKKDRNAVSGLFGDISSITLNHSSNPINNTNYKNLFGNPFLPRNRNDSVNKNDRNSSDKDKAGSDSSRKIVKIIGAKESVDNKENELHKNNNNNLIILSNNNPFIINAADKQNENAAEADLVKNNEDKININSDEDKKAEKPVGVTEISSSEVDLISKIKAIVEQKLSERESKLNSELEKLRKKTDQQEAQLKSLEERNLELQVEIANLKSLNNNENINDKNLIGVIESQKPKSKKQKSKEIKQRESTKITSESQFEIISSALSISKQEEENKKISEIQIKQMENSLRCSLEKVAKIEQALNFQSDVNKLHKEKLNFLLSESLQTKTQIGNINDSLDNFMEMIARIKGDLREEARYTADFRLGVLKREMEQMREIQIYHSSLLDFDNKYFSGDFNNLDKDVNESLIRGSDYYNRERDSFEDRFGRAKSFVVSNAIVKDFYKRAKSADEN